MAEIIWTEPALSDLDAVADNIALDKPDAARKLVKRIFDHVDKLADHPKMGSLPTELEGWHYRQIVEPPVRVFYRYEKNRIYVLHVMRSKMQLKVGNLKRGTGRDS
jgi:plasmid stabilization system protein ParE